MNARILKKLSKRAMAILIARHGYRAKEFSLESNGSVSLSNCDRKHQENWTNFGNADAKTLHPKQGNRHGYVRLFKNTPFFSYQTSYEENEWDGKPAWEILQDVFVWSEVEVEVEVDGNMTSSRRKKLFPSEILHASANQLLHAWR